MNNKYDEIERLNRLRHEGALTEEEFQREKRRVLEGPQAQSTNRKSFTAEEGVEVSDHEKNGTYAMFMHLALFVPSFGWLASIIMWQIKKSESPLVQQHGATIANFLISMVIYMIVFWVLSFFFMVNAAPSSFELISPDGPRIAPPTKFPAGFAFIFIPFLGIAVLFIMALVFLILNVMRAKKGEAASYPFAFKIFDNRMPKSDLSTTDHLIL